MALSEQRNTTRTERGPADEERTFLFTDIEGSTQLWDTYPVAMRAALARHDTLLHEVAREFGGEVFKTVGDAFCIAFHGPQAAIEAAVEAQRRLQENSWGEVGAVRVRMGIHVGCVEARDNDYFGPPLNRAARLRDAGNGGQILVSDAVMRMLPALPPGVTANDEGEHELKGLEGDPLRLYQLYVNGLPHDTRKLRTRSVHPHNLPPPTSAFVGRQAEARTVRQLLSQPGVRLVTLTGMGGTGKTRLAIEVAEQVLGRYPAGIWFADLAPLSDPALVMPTLLRACGLEQDPTAPPVQQLAAHFSSEPGLLVLDNFEQVEDAADDIAALLRSTRHLQILVTSRVLLHLSMEHEYPVPPLRGEECISLFVTRARQARPDLDDSEGAARESIRALCEQLDGMPLAVELAAAQARTLSPTEIREALDRRFQVLATRMRDLPPRHRSLRGAIDWSYDLLTEEERALFRSLSVFVGGFTAEAVGEVCSEVLSLPTAAVSGLLEELRGKSLLRRETIPSGLRAEGAASTPDGAQAVRYLLLESLREYGRERLEREEPERLSRLEEQHIACYVHLAGAQGGRLTGVGQREAVRTLEAEIANLRAAMERALTQGKVEAAARCVVALRRFWEKGWAREAWERLEAVITRRGEIAEPALETELLFVAGCVAWALARTDRAMKLFEESAALSRIHDNAEGEAKALTGMGAVAYRRGDLDQADHHYERALELKRKLGDRQGEAALLNNQGVQAVARGDYARATALFERCLAINHELGDDSRAVNTWNSLGSAAAALGDTERARRAFETMLQLIDKGGDDPMNRGCALLNLGTLALQEGDYTEAGRLLAEARDTLLPTEYRPAIAECLSGLGLVAAHGGETLRAFTLCREGLHLHRESQDRNGMASALEALAEAAVAVPNPDPDAALLFLETASDLRRETGARHTPPEAALVARTEEAARGSATGRGITLSVTTPDARLTAAFAEADRLWSSAA